MKSTMTSGGNKRSPGWESLSQWLGRREHRAPTEAQGLKHSHQWMPAPKGPLVQVQWARGGHALGWRMEFPVVGDPVDHH